MKRISDILSRNKTSVVVENGTIYKQVTIRTNYKGVVLRGTQDGATILTKNQFAVSAGQFILSRIDARNGAFGIVPQELHGAIVTNDFLAFDINEDEVAHEFFNVFLQSPIFLEACIKASRGNTNRKRIDEDFFLSYRVSLPPLREQHKLIKQINKGRSKIAFAQVEITYQQSLLSKLRQVVLQEAIQGKLTAAWRAANRDVEPASQLLDRIRAEKARLIGCKKLRPERSLPKHTTAESPFEIPSGWEWTELIELCKKTGAGSTPSGGKAAYSASGIPFLRSQNVHDDGLVLDNVARISDTIHRRMEGTIVVPGDLLLNITGGSIGRCAVVTDEIDEANVNQHVAIVRPVLKQFGKYLHVVILSPYFQRKIGEVQTGAGREGLPKNKMDRIAIPVPPLAEQAAIVARVKALMATCKALEAEIEHSSTHAAQLLQAVLKEAFASNKATHVERRSFARGFARQLIAAEILDRHHRDNMTQMKLQKLIHLVEHHARLDEIHGDYQRQAAGPYDNTLMYGIASGLERQKWFEMHGKTQSATYSRLEKAGGHKKYLSHWAEQLPQFNYVLTLLGNAKPEQCEVVSTLYAAWNDMLIEGRVPSDEEIITEASHPDRWHSAKGKIAPEKWPKALKWMREKRLIPTGYGRHTRRLKTR